MNISAKALSREKIRKMTFLLRETFGIQNVFYFPIPHFIEWVLGNPEYNNFNYEIIPTKQMKDTYGTTNTINNIMQIREDVYNGAVEGNPRDRFTLCHELGHYFLHQPEFVSYARGKIPTYCQPEWQANTFAAELMAPYHLTKKLSAEEIAQKCGMSKTAANIQYNIYHKF